MPVGFSEQMRLTSTTERIITLTPPGMKKNEVLQYIVDDIVQAGTEDIAAKDTQGRKVLIFY